MKKYFNFSGTATRSEYWAIFIINIVCASILGVIAGAIISAEAELIGSMLLIATIAIALWISIASIVRRCRDAGINPLWALASLIPWVGTIVFIVIGCLKTSSDR